MDRKSLPDNIADQPPGIEGYVFKKLSVMTHGAS
jgi:hypothetical protein